MRVFLSRPEPPGKERGRPRDSRRTRTQFQKITTGWQHDPTLSVCGKTGKRQPGYDRYMRLLLVLFVANLLSAADRDVAVWTLRQNGRVMVEGNPRMIDS